ncbi:hypothetical protein [Streptomyces cyaneofuscatus]|uniref:hypothetical protein n=1 Tax=Streptomyces cyaneofuscatus TaxID=66883 RepID=UPI0033AB3EC8
MQKTTDPTPTAAEPGWCDWHEGPSGTAVLIQAIEQSSGPGITRFACAPCREQRGLIPYGEQR